MNKSGTWMWPLLALALLAFILLVERRWQPERQLGPSLARLLPDLSPDAVTRLQVRRGRQFVHLERAGKSWKMVTPVVYPAQPVLVDNLIQALGRLTRLNPIVSTDLAPFGLEEPQAIIVVHQGRERLEVQIGNATPVGNQVYVRAVGVPGIYAVDASILDMAPSNVNEWRSKALLTSEVAQNFDRLEVRSPTRGLGFVLSYNPTNKTWRLSRPMAARADRVKVEQLLLACLQARVEQFVSDDPKTDLEPLGLQPPQLELALGQDTNDLVSVTFGNSPSNQPAMVYARRLSHSNIVLVSKELVEKLAIPFTELRDRHLFSFVPELVTQIELLGEENITIRRQTNGLWRVTEPDEFPADGMLVMELLGDLFAMQVSQFEKDIVTDFSPYGLAQPLRQVTLKTSATNETGLTNIIVAQAFFGTNGIGHVFARRHDETSVYEVTEADLMRLPFFAWQVRERKIWNFNVTNVVRVTVRQGERVHQLIRRGQTNWVFGTGSQGLLNAAGVESVVGRLGQLSAAAWAGRGAEARSRLGFNPPSMRVEIEVNEAGKLNTYTLEFGAQSRAQVPWASVQLDGQWWCFEFPWHLYRDMARDLFPVTVPAG